MPECPHCQRELRSERGLISHMEACIGRQAVFQGVRTWEQFRSRERTFTNRRNYHSEQFVATSDAWDSDERAYMCPSCGKGFPALQSLQAHFDTGVHDSVQPFTCRGCNRSFARMSQLKQHQETSSCSDQERLSSLMVDDLQRASSQLLLGNGGSPRMRAEATLYFDGGARDNPNGPGGAGYVLRDHRGRCIVNASVHVCRHRCSSNMAEYAGLICGLRAAARENIRTLTVKGDSEVVIKQMTGQYGVRHPNLIDLHAMAEREEGRFDSISYEHIPREDNTEADTLARNGIDETFSDTEYFDY